MDTQKKTVSTKEKATVELVLCSPHFDDIVLIAPEALNDIPITSEYQEIPVKQIRKKYFEVESSQNTLCKKKRHYIILYEKTKKRLKII